MVEIRKNTTHIVIEKQVVIEQIENEEQISELLPIYKDLASMSKTSKT